MAKTFDAIYKNQVTAFMGTCTHCTYTCPSMCKHALVFALQSQLLDGPRSGQKHPVRQKCNFLFFECIPYAVFSVLGIRPPYNLVLLPLRCLWCIWSPPGGGFIHLSFINDLACTYTQGLTGPKTPRVKLRRSWTFFSKRIQ